MFKKHSKAFETQVGRKVWMSRDYKYTDGLVDIILEDEAWSIDELEEIINWAKEETCP